MPNPVKGWSTGYGNRYLSLCVVLGATIRSEKHPEFSSFPNPTKQEWLDKQELEEKACVVITVFFTLPLPGGRSEKMTTKEEQLLNTFWIHILCQAWCQHFTVGQSSQPPLSLRFWRGPISKDFYTPLVIKKLRYKTKKWQMAIISLLTVLMRE